MLDVKRLRDQDPLRIVWLASLAALVLAAVFGNVPFFVAQAVVALWCSLAAATRLPESEAVSELTTAADPTGTEDPLAERDHHRNNRSDPERPVVPSPAPVPDPPRAVENEDPRWMGLVEGCAGLLDELDRHRTRLDPAAVEMADHVSARLEEVLERSGVSVIADEATFDRARHRPEGGAARGRPGAQILETLRPGLAVGRRVFRPALVRLSPRETGPEGEPSP